MPQVSFVRADGSLEQADAQIGESAMRAAVTGGVEGILAECGGEASCATCHVYVQEDWATKVGDVGPDEDDMLDFAESPRKLNSRLSCQIAIVEELDGLVLHIPESQ